MNFFKLNCKVSGEFGEEYFGRILCVKWGKRGV